MSSVASEVLSGIDLLMNPKKRAPSDAMSTISSASSSVSSIRRSHASHASSASSSRHHRPTLNRVHNNSMPVHDATVRLVHDDDDEITVDDDHQSHADYMMDDDVRAKPAAVPQHHAFRPVGGGGYGQREDARSISSRSSSSSEASSDASDSSDGPLSEEEIYNRKREILYQLDRLEKKGVRLPRKFTMADTLDDMRSELDRLKLDREVDGGIKFQRRMLMACVTGIEFLNNKFDPMDVKLDGWSDSINENIDEYDDVFEELYVKYRGKAKMAPELKLLFMVGGSGVMFHLTNSMFRQSNLPDLSHVMKQNPDLMRQFTQATLNTMNQAPAPPPQHRPPPPPTQGGGGIFGILGSMFGGGGRQPPPPQAPYRTSSQPPPPPNMYQPQQHMKGPMHVDDILRELHNDTFPQTQQSMPDIGQRIEIVSNATESEISELPDIADVVPVRQTVVARGGGRRRGAGKRGGASLTVA